MEWQKLKKERIPACLLTHFYLTVDSSAELELLASVCSSMLVNRDFLKKQVLSYKCNKLFYKAYLRYSLMASFSFTPIPPSVAGLRTPSLFPANPSFAVPAVPVRKLADLQWEYFANLHIS